MEDEVVDKLIHNSVGEFYHYLMHLSMLSCWWEAGGGGGGGGQEDWAEVGDLNSDHLFTSNARPQEN